MTFAPTSRTHLPNLGLLLDVDGPIASPVTRTIAIPSIVTDLVALAAACVPIAFITGRSDAFIREQVVEPLLAAGLADALRRPGARMYGVFEKGASWATIDAHGMGAVEVDASVSLGAAAADAVRQLVAAEFGNTMFFDETKRAMISVEQNPHIATADYVPEQARFQDAVYEVLTGDLGIGLRYRDRSMADGNGAMPFRIDPTIISTDIESVLLDKDRGAARALEQFAQLGPLPQRWRTVGDSRSDYKMADQLHADGFEVAHVDVRPKDGILERDYPVITEGDLVNDEAGAAFLAYWRAQLGPEPG